MEPEITSSFVERQPVLLAVVRAASFPQGIGAAWETLEGGLASLKGRKMYGVTIPEAGSLVYYAGTEVADEAEAEGLGRSTLRLDGGRYVRVKLENWPDHTDQIGPIFDHLISNFEMRPGGATLEYYYRDNELHLLVPLADV
ncbi:MAG: GyrI-like domain-containing protein [Anaerolineales bacterium]|nr:GyrI-like domain-containing protein [Anaerolineales bacterium]MCB9126577.1 GyrI-like domain-containing protein [Ardenticatenales bacterium]MCB9172497.1 GyrI-like domain-containing protein [Ardenticatenales bacterium]